jgi:low temperature requirement protein LtrA
MADNSDSSSRRPRLSPAAAARLQPQETEETASVSTLELFFDLVFVFALTRVTDLMAETPTGSELGHGILAMAVLWWSWVGYAWLGNVVRADEGIIRVILFCAMCGMFVAAVALPEAFTDLPGGINGPLVFAVAYFLVRALHIVVFWLLGRGDDQLRGQVMRYAMSATVGTALIIVATTVDGWAKVVLWVLALTGDYLGTMVGGDDWKLRSPSHFAERHGLIIIVALGESIVAVGIGAATLPISWPIIAGCTLGLCVSGLLWWAYFDVPTLSVEHALKEATGRARVRIARMCYSFLHLPMVVGIVMMSLALELIFGYVGESGGEESGEAQNPSDTGIPLSGWPLISLYGGVALYLLALILFAWYGTRERPHMQRPVVVVVLLALIPVVWRLPALVSLAILALVLAAMIIWELAVHAETRDTVRAGD